MTVGPHSATGAVAFDWNGTVVDDIDRVWEAARSVLGEFGAPEPDRDTFRAAFRLPLERTLARLGFPDERRLGDGVRRWNEEIAARPCALMPGAVDMLVALRDRGAHLSVISAAGPDAVGNDLDAHGVRHLFDDIFTDAIPKRRWLAHLRDRTGAGVAFVGDTEYDVEEALGAGAVAVGYAGGYRPAEALRAAGAHHVVASLSDVPGLVAPMPPIDRPED